MPKLEMDPPYRHLRGQIGGLVYTKSLLGTTVAKARSTSQPPPSPAQQAVKDKFRAAVTYAIGALADPPLAARYAIAAKAVGLQSHAFAIKDYFTPPVVKAVDPTAYHGAVGEVIHVQASDLFEVAGVTVAIRSAGDVVLEQGAAKLVGKVWVYTATTVVAAGTAVTIEAVATDQPGHTGTLSLPLVVA